LDKCARMVREGEVNDKVRAHFGKQYVAGMLQVAIAQERYQDARDLLDRQMQQIPDNPKTLLTGAEIEFKAGNLAKCQSYLEKVSELVPDARPFESVFARWFRDTGKVKEAEKWILAAAEKYPEDGASQMDYVNWRMGKGDLEGVRAALPKVESLTGETTAVWLIKGQLAFAEERMDEAESFLLKVIDDTNGRNLEAVNLYALTLAESSDPEKQKQAQKVAQQALGRAPRSSIVKASLAYTMLKQGITEQPQRLLLPIVRGERVSPEIAYFFGYLLNSLGNPDAARKALQSALETEDLFLYRKKCQKLLDQLGGPISSDLPAPADSLPTP
ncbi:tetratricopeptide repeat protein, partial [Mariniblastus sp.]|nr:tetratricopeptide repeat protein [Mariniblastus sp.]